MKNNNDNDLEAAGQAMTDAPQPIAKDTVLQLIRSKMEALNELEAKWDAQETEQLLKQQSYQLDDLLEPDMDTLLEETDFFQEVDYEPLVNYTNLQGQIAFTLVQLDHLLQAVQGL